MPITCSERPARSAAPRGAVVNDGLESRVGLHVGLLSGLCAARTVHPAGGQAYTIRTPD
jgi:hypothetical protein